MTPMSRNFLKRLEHQTKYRKITRKPKGVVKPKPKPKPIPFNSPVKTAL